MVNRKIAISFSVFLTFLVLYARATDDLMGFVDKQLKRSDLRYLKEYNRAYPNKVKLLGNNPLTKRLKILMNDRYGFLKNTWAVETPIEIKNNLFSAWGCQQHNCSNTNFIIVVDFKKNVVYVGIRVEENVKVYSEDGSSNILVSNWASRTN